MQEFKKKLEEDVCVQKKEWKTGGKTNKKNGFMNKYFKNSASL